MVLKTTPPAGPADYGRLVTDITTLLDQARRAAVRMLNRFLAPTYWQVGRRIVEFEQSGKAQAKYGEVLLLNLARDLTARHGRGFSKTNIFQMRAFYLGWEIFQTLSGISEARVKCPTLSGKSDGAVLPADAFPLSWSQYVRLMAVEDLKARAFYEEESIRGGWTVRQLDRQVGSQFYERTLLSRDKAAMLRKGARSRPGDRSAPEEQIKEPYILEFLGLKDEYSESDLEEALIRHLEAFLLELDRFTHADAGQMHLYLNFAREHWTHPDENPPVGLILCTGKDEAVAHYALEGLPNKVLAAEYKTALPDARKLAEELRRTKLALDGRWAKTNLPRRRV